MNWKQIVLIAAASFYAGNHLQLVHDRKYYGKQFEELRNHDKTTSDILRTVMPAVDWDKLSMAEVDRINVNIAFHDILYKRAHRDDNITKLED